MRSVIALATVLLAAASTAAIAAPLPPAPANGTIEQAREAKEGGRREDRRQDRRQTELQAPTAEAGAVLVREGASGGGRQRQSRGTRGA